MSGHPVHPENTNTSDGRTKRRYACCPICLPFAWHVEVARCCCGGELASIVNAEEATAAAEACQYCQSCAYIGAARVPLYSKMQHPCKRACLCAVPCYASCVACCDVYSMVDGSNDDIQFQYSEWAWIDGSEWDNNRNVSNWGPRPCWHNSPAELCIRDTSGTGAGVVETQSAVACLPHMVAMVRTRTSRARL